MTSTIALHRLAEAFLSLARQEARVGYASGDRQKIRNAAERAWMAGVQATDAAMARYGLVPEPGSRVDASRREFLAKAGSEDLSRRWNSLGETLHEGCYNWGRIPEEQEMAQTLEEVAEFIRQVTEET